MVARLLTYWDRLRSQLWFTPFLIVMLAAALAWVELQLDDWAARSDLGELAWAFSGGPESARQLLGTLAGSMITLTGVTFSITLAALALAAGQYSPRTLRNFMRDRFNQTVLGVFIGTFVFCILVLRSVRAGSDPYVPAVGVTTSILLAIVSLGFFIFFIHHIASSIQASSMIHAVSAETHHVIGKLFEEEHAPVGPAALRAESPPVPDGFRIRAGGDGYVNRIDTDTLCELTESAGVTLELLVGPGDFVTRGAPVGVADREPNAADEFSSRVVASIMCGRQRTMAQDPSFGFRQLVDIAVRALSPGINDPTTACNAIDYLGSLLVDLAGRTWPASRYRDADGTVRLQLPAASFADYLALAFTEIRRYGSGDLDVTLRLLDALAVIAGTTTKPDHRAAIRAEALTVVEGADRRITETADRRRINDALRRFAATLGGDPAPYLLGTKPDHRGFPSPTGPTSSE